MNIWLICPYGPVPGEGWRQTRCSMMGETLAKEGHEVVWWTATFSHHSKRQRASGYAKKVVTPGFSIQFIPTPGYQSHVGVGRLLFEIAFAWRVYSFAKRCKAPDVIIVCDGTLAWAQVSVNLAKRFGAKLIVDIVDLHPEVFAAMLPPSTAKYHAFVFAPLFWLRRRSLRSAAAIIAVSQRYLDTALKYAPPMSVARALVVYWGVDISEVRATGKAEEQQHVAVRAKRANEIYAIYAGTLGVNYDIETLLAAAELLQTRAPSVKMLIAGNGPRAAAVTQYARNSSHRNVTFLGSVSGADLASIYQGCDIGLSLYSPNSMVAMPIKIFDYLAAGLPIVNSLEGELADLLKNNDAGIQYSSGNADSLAEAIRAIAEDSGRRLLMARNASTLASLFESHAQYTKLGELINTLDTEPIGLRMVSTPILSKIGREKE